MLMINLCGQNFVQKNFSMRFKHFYCHINDIRMTVLDKIMVSCCKIFCKSCLVIILQVVYIMHSIVKSCRRLLNLLHQKSLWKSLPQYGACKLENTSLSSTIYIQLLPAQSKVSVLSK